MSSKDVYSQTTHTTSPKIPLEPLVIHIYETRLLRDQNDTDTSFSKHHNSHAIHYYLHSAQPQPSFFPIVSPINFRNNAAITRSQTVDFLPGIKLNSSTNVFGFWSANWNCSIPSAVHYFHSYYQSTLTHHHHHTNIITTHYSRRMKCGH